MNVTTPHTISQLISLKGLHIMAKRTSKSETVDYTDLVWVIDNLPANELKNHDKKPYSAQDGLLKISEMIELDFKVSIRFDDYSQSLQITAVCLNKKATNAGLGISARSDDLEDCISILCYKLFDFAKGDLRQFADKVPQGVRG